MELIHESDDLCAAAAGTGTAAAAIDTPVIFRRSR
jgi:hypothetical protein